MPAMSVTLRPVSAVVAAAVLFGTAGTAQALGPSDTTPLGVGAVRISVGVLVLWLATMTRRSGPVLEHVSAAVRSNWRRMVIGGVGVATYTPAFFAAVDRVGVAVGTVVAIGSGPFFAGALEWVWHGRRPQPLWLIGSIATVSGAALLVLAPSGSQIIRFDGVGVMLALASGAGYAVYSVTSKATMDAGIESTIALAVPFTIGAVLVAAAAVGEPLGWVATGAGLAMTLHLGVAATGVAYLLFGYGLQRLSSATTVTLVLAEPLTATLLATLVLGETLSPSGWVGVASVGVGLLIVGRAAESSPSIVRAISGSRPTQSSADL